jgi:hypothetical protein
MGRAIELRTDYTSAELRRLAKRGKDVARTRRLLAIAAVLDGSGTSYLELCTCHGKFSSRRGVVEAVVRRAIGAPWRPPGYSERSASPTKEGGLAKWPFRSKLDAIR